jgi:hypothetical protein
MLPLAPYIHLCFQNKIKHRNNLQTTWRQPRIWKALLSNLLHFPEAMHSVATVLGQWRIRRGWDVYMSDERDNVHMYYCCIESGAIKGAGSFVSVSLWAGKQLIHGPTNALHPNGSWEHHDSSRSYQNGHNSRRPHPLTAPFPFRSGLIDR